ncbi:phosphatase domain-containing putative toxin [Gymnodinialimonas ulvae]|uniref:phosphatase domain-containing putative toxin n=1 Tax=Gymnodinialimonas ulvae TaxID=3126504 RepID=UPI0030ABE358
MALTLADKLKGAWTVVRWRYDHRLDSELGLWQGRLFAAYNDHGFLRRRWRNAGVIAPGVFRGNHPDARALAEWKARGVVEVISLRPARKTVHAFEVEACAALGLRLRNVPLAARSAPQPERLLELLDVFDTLNRPALIHCKSGADRTGLAAAMWAIHVEGRDVAEAHRALGLRHLHIRWSKTGVLDRFLEAYAARLAAGPIPLRRWISEEYDPDAL